ncbi:LRR receptor-like kinase [Quillaja saponaria]|uniref:LRR receptor-like kinase n=1 Tax=Quillaja saponaria TaxID=32244 RepID=A0AAD7LDY6_QUISA|nr:LRR receptor-like kinase [Quillaja saponaria]
MSLTFTHVYNFSAPVCSWQGVFCDSKKEYVVELMASGSGLSGPIPDTTIGKLTKLQSLDLSNNLITGLPSDLWSLGSLKSLNLSFNKISGSLPNNVGNFGFLESFDLSSNNFSGEIPEAISSLVSLRVLKLDHNMFEQGIPSGILNCQSLVSIDLSSNSLNGSLPDGFGAAFPKLKTLNIAGNKIYGRDSDFSGLKSVTSLNISDNLFQGSVMGVFQELLEVIDLSRNQFQGHVSQLSNLNTIDLSGNHLTGKIPSLTIRNLQILDVSHNNLSGEIPLSILEKLPWMETFNFSYNNFTLCALEISLDILQRAFAGSANSCPIAANPGLFKRKANEHKGLKLALALTLSMICLLAGLLFLAFGCQKKTRMWAVKQTSYKEEQNISGPFSFQTDSTTWVADVKQATSVPVVIFEKPLLNITFADLLSATSNFDRGILLAEGKFGPVYRGFLPSGINVAVKLGIRGLLYMNIWRMETCRICFMTCLLASKQKRIGAQIHGKKRNNNGIQNVGSEGLLTTWRFRHTIALGTARALAFLHHGCSPPIIHRDVKASSVYLDYNLEPRLSDFGLAKVFGNGLDEEIDCASPGYVPPEFSQPENDSPTPKSDVYCFGVVLFELITGKKPLGDDYTDEREANLVGWVRGLVRKNQSTKAIDPRIRDTGPDDQMEEALKIGYLCTADLPSKRPSMQQIVGLLKDIEPKPQ